jgi:hypothetical protein
MRIIEITALSNGAHRNQTCNLKTVPSGWAVVPEAIKTENFPFGDIEVEEINGVMTVVSWSAREIPVVEEVEAEPTTDDVLNALLGVTDDE